MVLCLNGKFQNEARASIPVNNRAFRYGDGCFETIKVVNGKIVMAEQHMERLFMSLQLLRFEVPSIISPSNVLKQIGEVVRRNGHEKLARVRVTAFRGEGGLHDAISPHPNLLVQSWPLNPESNTLNENGLVLDIFKGGIKACDTLANLKSNNYLLYAMAALEAKASRANDMLVLNQHGRLADSTIANVWIIEGNRLITPPLEEGPVKGTLRRYMLDFNFGKSFIVEESPVSTERLLKADEVFLTNAIYGLKWVKQIADRSYRGHQSAMVYNQCILQLWQ